MKHFNSINYLLLCVIMSFINKEYISEKVLDYTDSFAQVFFISCPIYIIIMLCRKTIKLKKT